MSPTFKEELPPQPPNGAHQAILVDFVDLGMVLDKVFGGTKHKVKFIFEIEHHKGPFFVSRSCTLTFGEKATLPKILAAFGINVEQARKGWSSDDLLGKCVTLITSINEKGWANIDSLTLPMKEVSASGTYRRREEKNTGYGGL